MSRETVRKWMIEAGLWRARKAGGMRLQQSHPQRPSLGNLVQIDGSSHRWFEDRGPYCTVVAFVDDANSSLRRLCIDARHQASLRGGNCGDIKWSRILDNAFHKRELVFLARIPLRNHP